MQLRDCATGRDGDAGERGLGDDGACVEGLGGEGLEGDAGVGEAVEEGVVEGGWAAEAVGFWVILVLVFGSSCLFVCLLYRGKRKGKGRKGEKKETGKGERGKGKRRERGKKKGGHTRVAEKDERSTPRI